MNTRLRARRDAPHRRRAAVVRASAVFLYACGACALHPDGRQTQDRGADSRRIDEVDRPPPDDPNVIAVRKFISQEPWLTFSRDGSRDPEGFKATVYLESGSTGRGVFGDGLLRVVLFIVDRAADGTERLTPMKQWQFTPEQSFPWRAAKRTWLGWGYGLRLPWTGIDPCGREIQLVFEFVRRDGQAVVSEPVRLRVPQRTTRVVSNPPFGPAAPPGFGNRLPAETVENQVSRPPSGTREYSLPRRQYDDVGSPAPSAAAGTSTGAPNDGRAADQRSAP